LDPPAHLEPEAQDVWRDEAAALVQAGVLTIADRVKFELLCVAIARRRQLTRHYLQSDGPVVVSISTQMDKDGGGAQQVSAKLNPLLNAEVKYCQLIDKLGSGFGMDPANRARLKTPEKRKDNWLDALTKDDEGREGDPVH
jgi:P27 family predicted phage terminase small subunit